MEVINQQAKESEIVEKLEILGKFNCSRDIVADAIKNKPETKKILENLVDIFQWNTETIETKEYVLSTLYEIALELPKMHEQRNRIAGWFEKMVEKPHFYGITKDGESELRRHIDEIMRL